MRAAAGHDLSLTIRFARTLELLLLKKFLGLSRRDADGAPTDHIVD